MGDVSFGQTTDGRCPHCHSLYIAEVYWQQACAFIESFGVDGSINEYSGETVYLENKEHKPDDPNYYCGYCGTDFNTPVGEPWEVE
jgi:hypothetical protein